MEYALTTVDWIICGVIGMSTLLSLLRGFVKEALSLGTWIAAVIVARLFAESVAVMLNNYIELPSMRMGAAYAILFLLVLIVGGIFNRFVGELIKMSGLTSADRVFGMAFGLVRGLILVVIAVGILNVTPLVQDPWWQGSLLIPEFLKVADWLLATLLESSSELLASA